MDFQNREFFDRLMATVEENNKMLHSMRRSARLTSIGRLLYWIFIIGITIGAFYYVQPYISPILTFYKNFHDSAASFQNFVQ